jgi:hypothetical protein
VPEGIKLKEIPDTQYLVLPYPEKDGEVHQRTVTYHRHIGKFYRWMTATGIPPTSNKTIFFEFESPTAKKPIRTFVPIKK